MTNSAQGSITIKRLRTGDNLYIALNFDKSLHQAVDPDTGTVAPDWGVAENQPTITPDVQSSRGNNVATEDYSWKYNGNQINFTGASEGGWTTDDTGKFKMNAASGALKIVKNLASKTNLANDTLEFTCKAIVGGAPFVLHKSIDVNIQASGASSYYGSLVATELQLNDTVTSSTLSTSLMLGVMTITDYTVKWYQDDTLMDRSGKSITINRGDVNGMQIFIAEFIVGGNVVARTGIPIYDCADEYIVMPYIFSNNKEVDTGMDVVVKAKVVKMKNLSSVYTPPSPTWALSVCAKDTFAVLKTSNTDTITITTAETDRDGKCEDVEVIAEVTW